MSLNYNSRNSIQEQYLNILPESNIDTAISYTPDNIPAPKNFVSPKTSYNNLIELFNVSNSLNEECYILDKQVVKVIAKPKEVFSSALNTSNNQNWIHPKNLIISTNTDFLIIPVIAGFLLLVGILVRYSKYLAKFFEGLIYSYVVEKFVTDVNVPTKRLLLLLDLLSIITLSFLGFQLLSKFGISFAGKYGSLLLFALIFSGLLAYRMYSFIIHKATELLIYSKNFTASLYFDSLIAIRTAGIVLFPLSIIILYLANPFNEYFLYIALAAFGLLFIYRLFRLISLFIKNSISLLYFILYLCALEIVPIIILLIKVQRM